MSPVVRPPGGATTGLSGRPQGRRVAAPRRNASWSRAVVTGPRTSTARSPYGRAEHLAGVGREQAIASGGASPLATRLVAGAAVVPGRRCAVPEAAVEALGDGLGDWLPLSLVLDPGGAPGSRRVAVRELAYDVEHGRVDQPGQRLAVRRPAADGRRSCGAAAGAQAARPSASGRSTRAVGVRG